MRLMFKILPRAEWEIFAKAGRFDGSAVDRRDGFIHFSYADQLEETACKHFAGQSDLVLLAIDRDAVGPALRDEVSRGGALFPHLHASLLLEHVRWMRSIGLGSNGLPVLPSLDEA